MICVNGQPSTSISVSSFSRCMLLYLLKTLFIMFKCHFTFLLIRSVISSFGSNGTSACKVEFWLSVVVSGVSETWMLRVYAPRRTRFITLASGKVYYLTHLQRTADWCFSFCLCLHLSTLSPAYKSHAKECGPTHMRMGAIQGLVLCWSWQLQTTPNTVQRCVCVPCDTHTHPHSRLNVLFIQTCLRVGAAQEVEIISLVALNLSGQNPTFPLEAVSGKCWISS